MRKAKAMATVGTNTFKSMVAASTNTEDEQNDNESVQYFYERMKADDEHQVVLEEEITVEDENTNNSELNRLNALTQDLKQIIVKHNLSLNAANDIVLALNNYGVNLPQNSLQVNDIQKTLSDIQTDIKEIKNYLICTQNDFVVNLPINGGLEELNDKLNKEPAFANYFRKTIKIYKPTKGKCPNTYGLSKTFTDSLLSEYNWDGSHGRKNFQQFKTLNRILYDAWGGEETFDSYSNYTKSIRNQFTTARVRRHKRLMSAKGKPIEDE